MEKSKEFIDKYSKYLLDNYKIILSEPEVIIFEDDSVDVEFRTEGRRLLVHIFNKENFELHYYGRDVDGTVQKAILKEDKIDLDLINWMKELGYAK